MQEQGAKDQSIAGAGQANLLALSEGARGLRTDDAAQVRARHDKERTVVCSAGIEVQPYRDKFLKYRDRRLDERLAFLCGPWSPAWRSRPSGDWDTQILVNRHQPVVHRGLLKVRALHSTKFTRNEGSEGG
jgi:hypothetical protein